MSTENGGEQERLAPVIPLFGGPVPERPASRVRVPDETEDRFEPDDDPVVEAAFAEHGVSIQTVRQEGRGDDAQLVVVSHRATDEALSATVEALRRMPEVRDVSSVMRVEADGE